MPMRDATVYLSRGAHPSHSGSLPITQSTKPIPNIPRTGALTIGTRTTTAWTTTAMPKEGS